MSGRLVQNFEPPGARTQAGLNAIDRPAHDLLTLGVGLLFDLCDQLLGEAGFAAGRRGDDTQPGQGTRLAAESG